jgi:hypothetical protein
MKSAHKFIFCIPIESAVDIGTQQGLVTAANFVGSRSSSVFLIEIHSDLSECKYIFYAFFGKRPQSEHTMRMSGFGLLTLLHFGIFLSLNSWDLHQ